MQLENNNALNLNDMCEKMKFLDEILKKDLFSNSVREVNLKIREDLLDFRQSFMENLKALDDYLVKLVLNFNQHKIEKENELKDQNGVGARTEKVDSALKIALEKKEYQCEILKKNFDKTEQAHNLNFKEYVESTEKELEKLKSEVEKSKYRTTILLKTINQLENKHNN